MRCQKAKRECTGYPNITETTLSRKSKIKQRKAGSLIQQCAMKNNGVFRDMLTVAFTDSDLFRLLDPETPYLWTDLDASKHLDDKSSALVLHSAMRGGTFSIDQILHATDPFSLPQGVPVDIYERATCFFISNFVEVSAGGESRGHLEFLMPLLCESNRSSALSQAFSSVALAAFGNQPNSRDLLPKAMDLYVKAIRQIHVALMDPKLSLEDSTLASVILLGLFEVSYCFYPFWNSISHISTLAIYQ